MKYAKRIDKLAGERDKTRGRTTLYISRAIFEEFKKTVGWGGASRKVEAMIRDYLASRGR